MKTPERSVEKIVEEFKALPVDVHKNDIEVDWLTQTLQTERQKREESCCCYSYRTGIHPCQCGCHTKALTQPNNPK